MNPTQEITTTSILSLFDTSKAERRSFVEDLLNRMDGDVNPLDVHLQIKCMSEIIEQLTDAKKYPESATRYKEMILAEAQKHGKKFDYRQAKIEEKEVAVKYDWMKCEDSELEMMLTHQESLTAKIKARQDFLKTLPEKGLIITDEETGETKTVYRPSKSSTTSIAVSLK